MATGWSIYPTTGVTATVEDNGYKLVFDNRSNLRAQTYTIRYEDASGNCGETTITQEGGSTPPPGDKVTIKKLTIVNNSGQDLYIVEQFRMHIMGCGYPDGCTLFIYTQYAKEKTVYSGEDEGSRCNWGATSQYSNVRLAVGSTTTYNNIECSAGYPVPNNLIGHYPGNCTQGDKLEYESPISITGTTKGDAFVMTGSHNEQGVCDGWHSTNIKATTEQGVPFNADGNDEFTITILPRDEEGKPTISYLCNPDGNTYVDPHVNDNG